MKSTYRCGVFMTLVAVCSATVPPCVTCDVFGEERVAAHINSPLNQSNLDKILGEEKASGVFVRHWGLICR